MQKHQHCIQVKIVYLSNKRAFSKKICLSFYFIYFYCYTIFHLFLIPLNIVCTSFHWKMATLHSGWNSWLVGTWGIFIQNLLKFLSLSKEFLNFFLNQKVCYLQVLKQKQWNCIPIEILDQSELAALLDKILPKFFLFRKNFPFFSWTTKYAISKFWCKNADIVFRPKFLTSRKKGHFLTKFALFLLFFIILFFFFFFFYRIFHVFLRSLNILPTCFQVKMATLHSGWNSWLVGIRGIFVQNWIEFFFSFYRIFPFFLDH